MQSNDEFSDISWGKRFYFRRLIKLGASLVEISSLPRDCMGGVTFLVFQPAAEQRDGIC